MIDRDNLKDAIIAELSKLPDGEVLSTTELMERIVPIATCTGERLTHRRQLCSLAVKIGKAEMQGGYCFRGPEDPKRKRFGHAVRPLFWHARTAEIAASVCPTCRRPL